MTFVGCLLMVALALRVVVLQRRLELVARAEHELRGPLTALLMACERGLPPGAELARVRLGLEDLTAARSGRRTSAAHEAVDLFEVTRAAARGAAAVDWSAGRTVARTDPRRLTQALGNLVANAAEHGRGPVVVRGRRAGARVRIEVVDRGPGIPESRAWRAGPRAGAGRGGARRGRVGRPWRGFARRRFDRRGSDRGRGLLVADAAARDAGARLEATGHPVIDIPITRP